MVSRSVPQDPNRSVGEQRLHSELVRESFEPLADYYARSKAHTDRVSLERLRELAEPSPDMIALDVATGPGHTAMDLAPHLDFAVGLDLTRTMLKKAKELSAARSISNLSLVQGNVYSLPAKTASERVGREMAAVSFKEYSLQDANTLEATQLGLESRVIDRFPLNDQEVLVRNFHKVVGDWVEEYELLDARR